MNGMPAIPLRRALTLFVALAAALTVLAACTSSKATSTSGSTGGGAGGSTSSAAGVGSVKWQSCNIGGLLGAGLKCASLSVPLNYSDPDGRKITLALSEVPATAPASQRLGDLLVNPGGPGASGRSLAASVAQGLSSDVADRYNIIGFDPRGVGSSVPALTCDPSFFSGERPDYIPSTKAAEQTLIGRARSYAADCEKRFGWLLPYMTSIDVARDMDSIRAALGAPTISYFGYS